ncbi:hypothetical protein PPERSA_00013 [Pseudocohnilembus persalinus]|uniref:Alternative oxidase n=1 Tax=Pseudocohnilembus persalinus TaxID=266149 RepID=A0A0V0QW70_PSEPJ|nr:hypothetical protein PPERSA_00013 [Pseudocohnilembus persalinus]|eukprot:KRX06133.1 hypothetical protein PPERSA_00013 [Pseudocohnilembus persalinus]
MMNSKFGYNLLQIQKRNSSLIPQALHSFSSQKPHFRAQKQEIKTETIQCSKKYAFPHPIWTKEEVLNCPITIKERNTIGDHCAYHSINFLRAGFDICSGYKKIFPWQKNEISEKAWINRVLYLENVAGIPGFVAAMFRHLRSLRKMERDQGWIHTLLQEAENERVHLITFLNVKQPGILFKAGVIGGQFFYTLMFAAVYCLFPRVAHRAVGHLEEQAVITYTHLIEEINREGSPVNHWKNQPAPKMAIEYWQLEENATLLDVVLAVRKDEEHHKDVNHDLANDYTQKMPNPYPPGM